MASTSRLLHGHSTPIRIPLDEMALYGDLLVAPDSLGIVIFVHGSGSSRFSPRNRHVAEQLNKHGLATLVLDLLTTEEQRIDSETMQYRFDIPWLAERTQAVVQWVRGQSELRQLPIGLFGASTGAAAAVMTAAAFANQIRAVVSRGGRPDLAQEVLDRVQAPTLFIVGGHDNVVLELNRKAMQEMNRIKSLKVIPGATHLFEEPGTLEQVASAASDWFAKYMQHPQDLQIASGGR